MFTLWAQTIQKLQVGPDRICVDSLLCYFQLKPKKADNVRNFIAAEIQQATGD